MGSWFTPLLLLFSSSRELLALNDAIGEILAFSATHRNTLVMMTADHDTGGMSLGSVHDWVEERESESEREERGREEKESTEEERPLGKKGKEI
jgi:alkaline phosphatase